MTGARRRAPVLLLALACETTPVDVGETLPSSAEGSASGPSTTTNAAATTGTGASTTSTSTTTDGASDDATDAPAPDVGDGTEDGGTAMRPDVG